MNYDITGKLYKAIYIYYQIVELHPREKTALHHYRHEYETGVFPVYNGLSSSEPLACLLRVQGGAGTLQGKLEEVTFNL